MVLRIERFNNRSVDEIQLLFSEELDTNIGINNVRVRSNLPNIPDLQVKSIRINQTVISITTNQQTPLALYFVEFVDVEGGQRFQSITGDRLTQAGSVFFFLGQERANDIRDDILEQQAPIYNTDRDTTVRKHLANVGDQMLKGRVDIRETGNANFLSEEVVDEVKDRGFGPNDRLDNEGAYEILRVSPNPTAAQEARVIRFQESNATTLVGSGNEENTNTSLRGFPLVDPFSLRSEAVSNEIVSNSERLINSFDGLIITVANSNVASLDSLILRQANGNEIIYDIPNYGYALRDNRYDTVHGRRLVTLSSNQIRLAEQSVLDAVFEVPTGNDDLLVSYRYVNNGISVTSDVISVTQVQQATREFVGPLLTVFSLDNFPIVNSNDEIPERGGVQWLDPQPSGGSAPFSTTHPAFISEITFDESSLPAAPGQFAVNYTTGQVLVYGASSNNGTGMVPPVATYQYRRGFTQTVDFNYAPDEDEIVAVPGRDLPGEEVKVSFNQERVLELGVDWTNESHVEVTNEFVENRLASLSSIYPLNRPVTNVFEIFNETTGETYTISRFTDNVIHFGGRQLPQVIDRENEQVSWFMAVAETMFVTEELRNNGTTKIFRIDLANDRLVSGNSQQLGSNVNNDIVFSAGTLFTSEFFYDDVLQSQSVNLDKITAAGEYLVDYREGIIYVRVPVAQSEAIGTISYSYGKIDTQFKQVLGVNDIDYRLSLLGNSLVQLNDESFDSSSITVADLPDTPERFLQGDSSKPILFGTVQSGVAGQTTVGSFEFQAGDGEFLSSFADGDHILRIPGEPDRTITSVATSKILLVDLPWTDQNRSLNWCIIDFNLSDGYKTATTHEIGFVNGVYSVTELQTLDRDSLTNFFDPERDTIVGNQILFDATGPIGALAAGTALAIDYSFGTLYARYNYVEDVIRISYEYGDNSINFSLNDALNPDDEYYVTYRYGALREKLQENFGALTQVEELTNFPVDFNRELYRDFLVGTLQGFVNGPTVPSIETLVESVTDIEPNITELTFNEWTVGRDNLHLQEGELDGEERYDSGRFDSGLVIDDDTTLSFPGEAYISHREGTYESWVTPEWNGIDNDATLTIDTSVPASQVYVGASGFNPSNIPFNMNRADPEPNSPIGRPVNFPMDLGFYIWFDPDTNLWNFVANQDGYGEITTSGEIYNVMDVDGYLVTSTNNYIRFDGYGDGRIGADDGYDGYGALQEFTWSSDDVHYVFDSGAAEDHNRLGIFKDGSGYLNFRVYDDAGQRRSGRSRFYNISHNIQDWVAGESHFVSSSWRLNTAEGIDELHLFVDGQEVSNLFKYGGRPQATTSDLYRTVADEVLTTAATDTVIGNNDGQSTAGSSTFVSLESDFLGSGIMVGDTLTILDPTADGAGSPYTIIGVGTTSLLLGSALTLDLADISFAVNQTSFTTQTNIDVEKFAVFVEDGYGVRTELRGLDATEPDYSVSRDASINTLTINNGVTVGDQIIINTLGLTQGRCRDLVYIYSDADPDGYGIDDGYVDTLRTRLPPPTSLDHVDISKLICRRISIEEDGYKFPGDGYQVDGYFAVDGYEATGVFTNVCQPSNSVTGKVLALTLGTIDDNIDFSGTNEVLIEGTTFAGPTSEMVSFSALGTELTTNFWRTITQLTMTFTAIDPSRSFGSIQIIENVPLTQEENAGLYAQVTSYDNGVFRLVTFGTGGLPFEIQTNCHYLMDYPISLNIPMSRKGPLYIGSDLNGNNQLDGVIDQVVFLNDMLGDIRVGEDPGTTRTVTQDFNSPLPLTVTPQTLMLLNLDDEIVNVDRLYKTFEEGFMTSSNSVNTEFGDAVVFRNNDVYKIDNGAVVLNNDAGSIEFWVSPIIDTQFDESNARYYIDATTIRVERVVSDNAISLTLPTRAKRVVSIRLINDDGSGTDFFEGGNLFIDGTTVLLGQRLPGAMTLVEVQYVPVDFSGDRLSIFKDSTGQLNFSIVADENLYLLSYPITWKRNTWHRVKATWTANSVEGIDRMRLFVDGVEGGTLVWGTPGLLYGSGVIYGQAVVGSAGANALVANIDLEDTFSEINVGNSFDLHNPSMAKMDNLRFSNTAREPSILGTMAVDLNYNSNLEANIPVVEDNFTTLLEDFNREIEETEFLSNLVSQFTPLFTFDVEIDDSFRRLTDERSRDLLISILNRMKPAHTRLFTKFLQELE